MTIESLLRKDVNKAKLTEEDKMETLSRIKMTTSLDDLSEADFIIEVRENHSRSIIYNHRYYHVRLSVRMVKGRRVCLGDLIRC